MPTLPQDNSPSEVEAAGSTVHFKTLLARTQSGDRGALNTLFERFYGQVEAIVHAQLARDIQVHRDWLASRFSTGDVVQDVFRSVLEDVQGFVGETERAFAGYLALVVRNRLIDAVRFHEAERRDGRIPHHPLRDDDWVRAGAEPLEQAARREDAERYMRALSELPERERLLVRARFEGAATFEELAEQLGYSSVGATRRAFDAARVKVALRLATRDSGGQP